MSVKKGNMYLDSKFQWNVFCGCEFNCRYCLDPNTLILMRDLSEKRIKDLIIGDKIVGIEERENLAPIVTEAIVLSKWITRRKSFKIELEDGTSLICSASHRWLTNRGWKYTIGSMSGKNKRPYLTLNNKIRKIYDINDKFIHLEETKSYKKGYLSGMIYGDGSLCVKSIEEQQKKYGHYSFRLALKDIEPLKRCEQYLSDFNIIVRWREFNETMKSIYITDKKRYFRIKKTITINFENKEFLRGFVSGFFDAEGSYSCNTLRVVNTNQELIDTFKEGLKVFGFRYAIELRNKPDIQVIRLLGNKVEKMRFFQIYKPAIYRKTNELIVNKIVNHYSKIKSIEKLKDIRDLIDIHTSTGNFIANGCVSHNCLNSFQRQMKRQKHNCIKCYNYEPHFHPERLKQSLPRTYGDEFIWVASSGDISFITLPNMLKILRKIDEYPNRTFFFQTKNPRFFYDYNFPDNVMLGVTLESNRNYPSISNAPSQFTRYLDFLGLSFEKKIITIEPILNFSLNIFVRWIKDIKPIRVYIGYDTKKSNLIEPSLKKTLELCEELSKFTKVKTKLLRKRLE